MYVSISQRSPWCAQELGTVVRAWNRSADVVAHFDPSARSVASPLRPSSARPKHLHGFALTWVSASGVARSLRALSACTSGGERGLSLKRCKEPDTLSVCLAGEGRYDRDSDGYVTLNGR